MQEKRITDDLDTLLSVLPPTITDSIRRIGRFDELIEVVMDLGRPPEARYVGTDGNNGDGPTAKEETLELRSDQEVTQDDIDLVVARIGEFDADNRAGMERTLHRICAIRNRRGHSRGPDLPRGPRRVWHASTSSRTSSPAARAS